MARQRIVAWLKTSAIRRLFFIVIILLFMRAGIFVGRPLPFDGHTLFEKPALSPKDIKTDKYVTLRKQAQIRIHKAY